MVAFFANMKRSGNYSALRALPKISLARASAVQNGQARVPGHESEPCEVLYRLLSCELPAAVPIHVSTCRVACFYLP